MNKTSVIEGTLSSGFGEGKFFTQLDWVVEQFRTKLGFVPYPGTLNLDITENEWNSLVIWFGRNGGAKISPESEAYCAAVCFPVCINDAIAGAVVVPEVTKHPRERLEIIAPVNLRATLGLSDGERVKLTFIYEEAGD